MPYHLTIQQEQMSNMPVGEIALSVSVVPSADPLELLRSITIDISEFNHHEDITVSYQRLGDALPLPAVKTGTMNGLISEIVFTFRKPFALNSTSVGKIVIGNIGLKETTGTAAREIRPLAAIGSIKNNILSKYLCNLPALQLKKMTAITGFKAPNIIHALDRLQLSWASPGVTSLAMNIAGRRVAYPVNNDERAFSIPLRTILKDLGQERDPKKLEMELVVNDGQLNKNIKIIQHNMWYRYDINNGDTKLIDLISGSCNNKTWGIAGNNDTLELWYCDDDLEWKRYEVSIKWSALKAALEKEKSSDPLSDLPPTVMIERTDGYELIFAGGSKVNENIALDTLFTCNIKPGGNETVLAEKTSAKFTARACHSLVVFEHNKKPNCVFIIGGTGNTNIDREVVIYSGDKCTPLETDNKLGLNKRHSATVTVHTDEKNKKSIWVAGGYDRDNNPVRKICRYKENRGAWNWEIIPAVEGELNCMATVNSDINTTAITSIALKHLNGQTTHHLHYLEVAKLSLLYAAKIEGTINNDESEVFTFSPSHPQYHDGGGGWSDTPAVMIGNKIEPVPAPKRYGIQTVGQNGYLWLIALRFHENKRLTSDLYYLKPELSVIEIPSKN